MPELRNQIGCASYKKTCSTREKILAGRIITCECFVKPRQLKIDMPATVRTQRPDRQDSATSTTSSFPQSSSSPYCHHVAHVEHKVIKSENLSDLEPEPATRDYNPTCPSLLLSIRHAVQCRASERALWSDTPVSHTRQLYASRSQNPSKTGPKRSKRLPPVQHAHNPTTKAQLSSQKCHCSKV